MDGPRALVCTAAGRECITLQAAGVLFNFDLPWNPMDVEQRIGRIHRYGQQHTAQVYNLVLSDTIEGRIFLLLTDKLQEIARTLGKVDEQGNFADDLRTQILGQLSERRSGDRELTARFTIDRELARDREEIELLGIDHPLMAKAVQRRHNLNAERLGVAVHSDVGPAVTTWWFIQTTGVDQEHHSLVQPLAVTPSGKRLPKVERTGTGLFSRPPPGIGVPVRGPTPRLPARHPGASARPRTGAPRFGAHRRRLLDQADRLGGGGA